MALGEIVEHAGSEARRTTGPQRALASPDSYDLYVIRKRHLWRPPTDVYETDQHVIVKVEIAGMDEGGLRISLANGRLSVTGERREGASPASKLTYQNMEILYGEFQTQVDIGWSVDESAIEAHYEAGFLCITLPKAPQRRIPITTRDS